jgi:hypothetical protein
MACSRVVEHTGNVTSEPEPTKAGSTLRFRVKDLTRGVESSTWSVVGSKRSGDLYFSGREIMGDLKISLHESGVTRMAWTSAAATDRVEPGADRLLSRWTAAEALPNDWSLVLRLSIPDSTLRRSFRHYPRGGPGRL